jgi:hypothetical protein
VIPARLIVSDSFHSPAILPASNLFFSSIIPPGDFSRFPNPKKERSAMNWLHFLSYFLGGVFLANAVPHFVRGIMGKPFQTPFAKPPGKGLSSSTVNVLWGFANFIFAYPLLLRVGRFDPRSIACIAPFAIGALLMSLLAARHFGELHGGNSPQC